MKEFLRAKIGELSPSWATPYKESKDKQERTWWSNAQIGEYSTYPDMNFSYFAAKGLADHGFGVKFKQAFINGTLDPQSVGIHALTSFDRRALDLVSHETFTETHLVQKVPFTIEQLQTIVDQVIEKSGLKPRPKPLNEYLPRRNPVIFERADSQGNALVIRPRDFDDLKHPDVIKILKSAGIPPDLFYELIAFKDGLLPKINRFSLQNEKGETKEDIEQRIVDTPLGKIEVSDCKLYQAAVTGRNDIGLHLKDDQTRGFEAILALSGNATLTFPERVEPIGGDLYFESKKRKSVEMTPGTLAVIPAPTASGWTKIEGDIFEFRYISSPPWRPDLVRSVK